MEREARRKEKQSSSVPSVPAEVQDLTFARPVGTPSPPGDAGHMEQAGGGPVPLTLQPFQGLHGFPETEGTFCISKERSRPLAICK